MNKTKWFKKYSPESYENTSLNIAQNIEIDGEEINIPLNLPSFIVGSKNAGKSTVIATLIKACTENNIYKRIIYIYTDHVDSTLAEICHENLIRVPLKSSIKFISEYFKIKSEYMSWIKFIDKNNLTEYSGENSSVKLNVLLQTYTDNIIDEYVRNNLNINKPKEVMPIHAKTIDESIKNQITSPGNKIKNHAFEYVLKYSEPFEIKIDDVIYHLDGLSYDQYDQLIIDDIGVANEYLFPTSMTKSPLYKFLTISRHILLGTIIAGQDILQLPKYARKEMNTYMFGYGLNIFDIDKTNVPKQKQREIIKIYNTIKQYDFVLYNGIDNVVEYMNLSE